jgi:hypothetical protein
MKKNKKMSVVTEFFGAALLVTLWAYRFFRLHPAVALLLLIAVYACCYLLFTKSSWFRPVFSAAVVLGWAALAYWLSKAVGHVSDATAWVFAMLAFLVSILLYKDFFEFKRYK